MTIRLEQLTNGRDFNLTGALSAMATTLAPPSYGGWPTSGQFRLLIDREILLVTDASSHPWPITRGVESTIAASHAAGTVVSQPLTAGALTNLVGVLQDGVLAATGQVLNFVGGGLGVVQQGSTVQVSVPIWSPLVDAANSALIFGPDGDVIDVPSGSTTGPTSQGADPTIRIGLTLNDPLPTVLGGNTFVELDSAHATINYQSGIVPYNGDSEKLEVPVDGMYLAIFGVFFHQDPTAWINATAFVAPGIGNAAGLIVPPASVFADADGFSLICVAFFQLKAGVDRPRFGVSMDGANPNLDFVTVEVQLICPLAL